MLQILFAAITLSFSYRAAVAEVVQTSPGVLQSSDLRAKVIVSYRTPGIFFLLGGPIELQLFDPSKILFEKFPANSSTSPSDAQGSRQNTSESPIHVFIEYSPELDRYTAVHVGQSSYRIKGGFSLVSTFGHPESGPKQRLTVDNNNPYLSWVYEPSPTAPPETLGFRGLDLVVKKSGQRYAALLEANQFNQLKGLIEPYTLASGVLNFKGETFYGASVGVELEPSRNPCLQAGASFLPQSSASTLRTKTDRTAALKELEAALKAGTSGDPFKGVLLLRVEPQEIIGLDYRKERVMVVRPLPRAAQTVCLIEEVSLE